MSSDKKRKVSYDLSAYSSSQFTVVKQTFAKRFHTSSNRLQTPILIDTVKSLRNKRQKEGDTRFFIRYNITDSSEAEIFFNFYEKIVVTHAININPEIKGTEQDQIERKLRLDPVGAKDPGYDDEELYTILTTIQVVLRHQQLHRADQQHQIQIGSVHSSTFIIIRIPSDGTKNSTGKPNGVSKDEVLR